MTARVAPRRLAAVLLLVSVLAPWRRARAQQDARLVAALRQAQEGQADSARATLRALLAATPPSDTLYPQILYTTALTAADIAEREHSLQRITIEYPLSPWTDDALLLLAENDYAGGNLPATTRYLDRLRRDFPASPLLPQAAFWAARTYFDMRNTTEACRWIEAGLARPDIDAETHNQLAFQAQRCGRTVAAVPVQPAVRDSTPAPAPPAPAPAPVATAQPARDSVVAAAPPVASPPVTAPTPAPAPTAAGRWRVQLAAAGSEAEDGRIVQDLRGAGITAAVTPEKGYYKVRTGHFRTSYAAQAATPPLRGPLGGGAFVVTE